MENKLFSLDNRRALITGSTQGIGLALAYGLARSGATIVLNGRDETRVRQAAEQMRADGFNAEIAAFDVTDRAAVIAGVEHIERDFGAIDVVINKAVVFGTLAAFITAVYVVIVVGLGRLVSGGDEPSLAWSIAATAIVASGTKAHVR